MSASLETILKVTAQDVQKIEDPMVVEYPVTLYLNEKRIITLMTIPGHLRELAVGFLFLKGLIKDVNAIREVCITQETEGASVSITSKDTYEKVSDFFELSEESIPEKREKAPALPLKTTLEDVFQKYGMTAEALLEMMASFSQKSELFTGTGGVHSIGLYEKGKPVLFYDDVSRYNTYNKLFGGMLLGGIDPSGKMLLSTGRIPSEPMTWMIRAGIPCVLSISAPTKGSVYLARKHGVVLMGFVRKDRFNLYA